MLDVNNLLSQFKAQPQKTAIMIGLTVILAVALLRSTRGPAAASAMATELVPPATTESPAGAPDAKELQNIDAATIHNTIMALRFKDPPPTRNIFAVDPNVFPRQKGYGGSTPDANEPLDPRQAQLEALQQQVREFHLQSTMTGKTPTAFINNTLVREGDAYRNFKVRSIGEGQVLLEAGGHEFSLKLRGE